jgi:hypothetical protein
VAREHVISTGGGAFAAVVERPLYFAFPSGSKETEDERFLIGEIGANRC